jgi:hypothetical protein
MSFAPAPADQLLEVGAGIKTLVVRREVVEDFGSGVHTGWGQSHVRLSRRGWLVECAMTRARETPVCESGSAKRRRGNAAMEGLSPRYRLLVWQQRRCDALDIHD